MGGKGSKQTIGYKHYVGEHLVLCHGPIDNVSRIEVDERTAWAGSCAGGPITVDAPNLFGGDEREGGVSGTVDIDMGGPTQGQNSYLVAKLGSDVPGYRGVVSAILRQCYLGNNPYLKPWAFRAQRIYVAQDGDEQWYSEKAGIPAEGSGEVVSDGWELICERFHPNVEAYGSDWRSGGFAANLVTGTCYFWGAVFPVGTVWYSGDPPDISTLPSDADVMAIGRFDQFGRFYSYGGVYNRVTLAPEAFDMNPAHIIRECLTNQDWGMGYQAADIDDTSFTAAADTLYDERMGMSLLWDRQILLEAFVAEIVKHIDAALYVSRTTGKFVLKLIRADYDEESLLLLNESNISKIAQPSAPTFGELTNSVTVNYWDAVSGKDASLSVQDPALVQMQGAVIGTTVQYPGFTNSRNAVRAAQRDLRSLSSPLFSCTVYANRDAKDLNIGDVFKLSWAKWQKSELVMRVTGLAFGDGKSNQVRISCTQDVFTTPDVAVQTVSEGAWVDPSQPPNVSSNHIAFEAPYYEAVQAIGQTTVDTTLATNPDVGYVMAAAAKPPSGFNARLWTNAGAGYENVGPLDFAPSCTLESDVDAISIVLDVLNASDFDLVEVGTIVQIGDGNADMELCRVDAVDDVAGTVTLGRGALDTTPKPHEAGTRLYFWDLYSGYDPTEYVASDEVDVKITPVSGAGVVDLADAEEDTVILASRAWRPYPPGNLLINSESYRTDKAYEDELTISWAHRDRIQQTSGTVYDHTDADIGPEAGTTYRLQGYLDGVLIHTEDDIAGTSTTWEPGETGEVTVEVHSKRDGVYSFQGASHTFLYTSLTSVRVTEDGGDYRAAEDDDTRTTED